MWRSWPQELFLQEFASIHISRYTSQGRPLCGTDGVVCSLCIICPNCLLSTNWVLPLYRWWGRWYNSEVSWWVWIGVVHDSSQGHTSDTLSGELCEASHCYCDLCAIFQNTSVNSQCTWYGYFPLFFFGLLFLCSLLCSTAHHHIACLWFGCHCFKDSPVECSR